MAFSILRTPFESCTRTVIRAFFRAARMRDCAANRERAGVSMNGAGPIEGAGQAIAESARMLPKDRYEFLDDGGASRLKDFVNFLEMETRGCAANSAVSEGISAVASGLQSA
jgi:hypothetical protein